MDGPLALRFLRRIEAYVDSTKDRSLTEILNTHTHTQLFYDLIVGSFPYGGVIAERYGVWFPRQ